MEDGGWRLEIGERSSTWMVGELWREVQRQDFVLTGIDGLIQR